MKDQVTRLVEAARRERGASCRCGAAARRQRPAAATPSAAAAATAGTLSRPWMRTISSTRSASAIDVGAPGRQRSRSRVAACDTAKPRRAGCDASRLRRHIACRRAARHAPDRKRCALPVGARAGRQRCRVASPPQSSQDQTRRELEAPDDEFRIDAAFEAVARVASRCRARGRCAAVRIGSNKATSMNTSVVASVQPDASPPMMPPMPCTPSSSAMTVIVGIERVGLAVERQRLLASSRAARARSPVSFAASKTCSGRPRSSVMKLVMSTSAEIGRRPIGLQPVLQPCGHGPFFTPRIIAAGERPGRRFAASAEIEPPSDRDCRTCRRPA